jgi:arachidonate 15-lipoxygenase
MPVEPTLPQNAPDAAARTDRIARTRESYAYDFSYADLCFVKSLPLRDEFPPRYLLQGAEVTIALEANRAAAKLGSWMGKDASAMDAWSKMFPLLPAPLVMAHAREDWCFAWQRLAGPTPNALKRIARLPEALPITDADLRRVLGTEKASVADALASARLYVADYALFDGVRAGVTDGHAKFLWAPIVLFCVDRAFPGSLRPIAIQVGGHSGTRETLYLPGDRDWMLARTAANVADENLQGVLVHLGWCHMVVERFILASYRQLAAEHPLAVLLAPHFETTLAVNQVARKSVVNPGGVQDRLLAPTIEAQTTILNRSVGTLDLASLDPTVDYARRGVDDAGALPAYPFRDDALPIWTALRRFVESYVRLYYASDADVTGDAELAAFVHEVGAESGGRLPAMVAGVAVETIGDVVDLISRIVFRATAYHATINNSNYDWAAYVPSMPTAGGAALPPRGTASDADLSAMLPPSEIGWETITATYQVANLHINWLGKYDAGHFVDARVAPLVKQFQADLDTIEADTTARNADRPLPYTFLLPSRITASINA